MDIKVALGKRVRALREQRGIKQYQLAELIDRSVDGLSLIERGENWPSAETAERIAMALGVPISDLFDGLGDDQSQVGSMHLAKARAVLARLPAKSLPFAADILEVFARYSKN